jgi:hypothetical protein
VFVNLWADPVGAPLSYRSVYDLVLRLRAPPESRSSRERFGHTDVTGTTTTSCAALRLTATVHHRPSAVSPG